MYSGFINGHGSTFGLWKYLLYDKQTGKKRSIYSKTYNMPNCLQNCNKEPEPWYKAMDRQRIAFGTNTTNNGKKALTFKHYIMSPDPVDNITPEELSEFIDEWLERGFATTDIGGKFDVAVEMHDDNGILHAHIVFNNINYEPEWEKGSRITSYLTPRMLRQTQDLIQTMAKERGWHNFLDKHLEDAEEQKLGLAAEMFEIKEISQEFIKAQEKKIEFFEEYDGVNPFKDYKRPIEIAANGRITATRKGSYIDKKEAEILKREGRSNKEDIRKCIDIAIDLSNNLDEFTRIMNCLNIKFEKNKKDDFVYTHPIDKNRKFTGYRLGYNYTYKAVISRLKGNTPLDSSSKAKRHYYTGKLAGVGVLAVYHYDTSLSIQDIANTVAINSKYNIWNNEDYDKLLNKMSESDTWKIKELKWAKEKNKEIFNIEIPKKIAAYVNRVLNPEPVYDEGSKNNESRSNKSQIGSKAIEQEKQKRIRLEQEEAARKKKKINASQKTSQANNNVARAKGR